MSTRSIGNVIFIGCKQTKKVGVVYGFEARLRVRIRQGFLGVGKCVFIRGSHRIALALEN